MCIRDRSDGVKTTMVFVRGIEVGLILAWGSKLTCVLCGGQNSIRRCVGDENYFFLAWGSIDLRFCVVGRNSLGFVCGPEITWF